VDQLTYTYQSNSNKLTQVADGIAALSYTAKDFKERSATAYTYDPNGNLKSNLDKQISTISYNHLNLPSEISFNTGAKIRFTYDAEGNKLTQRTYNTSGTLTTTQDYLGEFVYQNGALDYLIHEEGRVAAEPTGLFYEYYLKDHLGNVRQVLRNPTANARIATMETGKAEEEEQLFTQLKPTRKREPSHNITAGGSSVAWLNAAQGEMVGPGTSQEIFDGDSIVLTVYGKYLDQKKQKANLASFVPAGGKTALLDQLNELALNTSRAGGANPIAVLNLVDILAKDLQRKEAPEAYLIYALYDQDSNRYEVGKQVLSRNAANQHEVLEEKLAIKKNGYIETFVVNETSEDVWFDNMMVMSVSSVIVQETHYDPWGLELTGLGYQDGGVKVNKYLYQGKEFLNDHSLNIYDFHARGYDPVIGRTWQVDPMADSYYPWSPYAWVMNNPLKYMDPTGMFSTHTDEDGIVVAVYDDGDLGVYRHGGSRSEAAENVKRNYSEDNKGAGGKRMGESLHALSFADQSLYNETGVVREARIKIDFGSSNLTDRVQEILNSDPSLFDYFKKAGGGGDWDIKEHVSNGSKLFGKYASPRDAGNFAAGAVAQKSGLAPLAQFGYGAYNLLGNNKPLTLAITGAVGWVTLVNRPLGLGSAYLIGKYGEDKLSQRSIDIGKDFIRRK
jgi:RHS repeat-associated protein